MKRDLYSLLLCLAMSTPALGGVVVVDFEEATLGDVNVANYYESGFRFSPGCHYDLRNDSWSQPDGSNWLGWDQSGNCGGGDFNSEFLGPPEYGGQSSPYLYVDFGGRPFSLLSLTVAIPHFRIYSSKGGFYDTIPDVPYYMPRYDVAFSGAEWTGIRWLLFATSAGLPVGFDNFTARVPTPRIHELLSLAALVAGLVLRLRASKEPARPKPGG